MAEGLLERRTAVPRRAAGRRRGAAAGPASRPRSGCACGRRGAWLRPELVVTCTRWLPGRPRVAVVTVVPAVGGVTPEAAASMVTVPST